MPVLRNASCCVKGDAHKTKLKETMKQVSTPPKMFYTSVKPGLQMTHAHTPGFKIQVQRITSES